MTFWIMDVDGDSAAILAALPSDASVELVALGDYVDTTPLARFPTAHIDHLNLDADVPIEAAAPDVVDLVRAGAEDVVLGADSPGVRSVLGAVAAAHGFPAVTDVREIRGDELVIGRFGGNTLQRVPARGLVAVTSPLFALPHDDRADASTAGPVADGAEMTESWVDGAYDAQVIGTDTASDSRGDLRSASRVVAAGRGVEDEAGLELVRRLADEMGAELTYTRPLTEGLGLVPGGRYIGLSGEVVAPSLYLGVGVSGAHYHMRGVADARLIVAINADPEAAIFGDTDYGIVGDLREVVPALLDALRTEEA